MTDEDCRWCGAHLIPDLGTGGWVDGQGRKWVGTAVTCPSCGTYHGRDDEGRLVPAAAIIAVDELFDTVA